MAVLAAVAILGIGCSTDKPVSVQGAMGSLRLSLSNGDEPAAMGKKTGGGKNHPGEAVEHIWITIKEVQLHCAGNSPIPGWKTVARPNQKFDFLELVNGLTAPLDLYALPEGHYTQIRLLLGDDTEDYYGMTIPANSIVINGETFPLSIPGAWRTGIKCVRSFFIGADEMTEICLAFDCWSAIHYSGGNGYMMRPAYRTFKCDGSDPPTESEPEGGDTETEPDEENPPLDQLESTLSE